MSELKGITINTAADAEAHIYAEDDAAIYKSIIGKDGVLNIGSVFAASISSNNLITLSDGVLCIDGHFARLQYGDTIKCEIANGQTGYNRNDLIVARFETINGVDSITIKVIEGTVGTTAIDPDVTQEDLYNGGTVRELPLYRVCIEGLSITSLDALFDIIPTISDLKKEVKRIIGYDSGINISNYKNFGNMYEVPSDGIVNITTSSNGEAIYAISVWVRTYVNGSPRNSIMIGQVQNNCIGEYSASGAGSFPVYKGQRIYLNDVYGNCLGTDKAAANYHPYIYE